MNAHRMGGVVRKGRPREFSTWMICGLRGASSNRRKLALLAGILGVFVFATLAEAKTVVGGFGTSGTLGGQFATPRGIDVNRTGNGGVPAGTTYVVDSQHRVQRFSPAGAFDRAWGQNVLGRDELQTIALSGVTGGSFTLSYNGNSTAPISVTINEAGTITAPSASQIQSALGAVAGIGGTNVSVSGGAAGEYTASYTVRFIGTLGGTDVSQLVGSAANLIGSTPSVAVATTETGSGGNGTGFEICTVAANCQEGLATATTANGGDLNTPQGVAVNQANGHVYVTDRGNRRIQEFDADGNFIRGWGWDVDSAAGTGFEICTVAASCKTAAAAGGGAGQFAANLGQPIVDSSNNVWLPDAGNNRIQEFSPTGAFMKAVGADVVDDGATGTGTLNGTTSVTGLVTTSKAFRVGQTLAASADIQAGTTITAVGSGTLTLSKAALTSGTLKPLTVAPGAENVPFNETQTVTLGGGPTGGTFTLTFTTPTPSSTTATTTTIPYNATAAELESKLGSLSNIGATNVAVSGPSGGPWTVEFKGTRFADTDVAQMSGSATNLTPAGKSITVTSANGLETCTIAADCRGGASGVGAGQFSGPSPGDLAFDSSGNLYAIDVGALLSGGKRVEKFNSALTSATDFATATLASLTSSAVERMTASQAGTRLDFAVNNDVTASERQIVEVDTGGAETDKSLVGSGLNDAIGGLAANDATGTLYATTAASKSPRRVLALSSTPLAAPVVAINPVSTKTGTTATFSGAVDPKGGLVSCAFEYSIDQVSWTEVTAPACDSLASGGGSQSVSVNATGLVPATHYFVRLAASRPLVANVTSGVKAFDTDGVPPVVSNVGAVGVEDTSARLVGTIDPRNSATGYVFEYGTTPALGSATTPVNIGGGTNPVIVSRTVTGLSPNTTYYFRLAATNLSGTTYNGLKTLNTRSDPSPPPDHRAYEMVSPSEKSGGGALSGGKLVTVAENGQAIQFDTTSLFGDPSGVQTGRAAPYVSRRTDSGWQTLAATPSACRAGALEDTNVQAGAPQWGMFSANLDMSVFLQPETSGCSIPPLSASAPLPAENLYRQEIGDASSYELLTPARAFKPTWSLFINSGWGGYPVGYSDDFKHVVYVSTGNQTPDAPSAGDFRKVYEWDNGVLRLASKNVGNNPFTTSAFVPIEGGPDWRQGENPVSSDGRRIFFQNPTNLVGECIGNPDCELYMREDGSKTYDVSQLECTSACGVSQADSFTWASPQGDKALFTSAAKLTDDTNSASGDNLYMFTLGADPAAEPHNLTLLSRDEEPADGLAARVQDAIGASDDGTTVFFVAKGQIVSGASTAPGPKIYRWRWNGGTPTIDYLATLNSVSGWVEDGTVDLLTWTEPPVFLNSDANAGRIAYERVTPDGKFLLVSSNERLDPVSDTDSTADLYRWNQADGWLCVTCQPPGVASAGDSIGPGPNLAPKSGRRMIAMSDDGQRIFFVTRDALVPEDTNGSVRDVYEWHDGNISLLSSGTYSNDVKLLGASHDGNDVFIYTEQRLVGWDSDDTGDIYDVRVGGGFPEPPPKPPVCEGEACRTTGTQPPGSTGAGTAAFEGPGNRTAPVRCPRGTRKTVTKAGNTICKKFTKRKHKQKKRQHGTDRGWGAAR
jgi:hypothetical protein